MEARVTRLIGTLAVVAAAALWLDGCRLTISHTCRSDNDCLSGACVSGTCQERMAVTQDAHAEAGGDAADTDAAPDTARAEVDRDAHDADPDAEPDTARAEVDRDAHDADAEPRAEVDQDAPDADAEPDTARAEVDQDAPDGGSPPVPPDSMPPPDALPDGDGPEQPVEITVSTISEVGVGGLRGVSDPTLREDHGVVAEYLVYPQASTNKVVVRSRTIVDNETAVTTVGTAPTTCAASGYLRSDGWNAIVYIDSAGHLHEATNVNTARTGDWVDFDLRTNTSIVAPLGSTATGCEVFAYQRTDSINAIVYRGTNNHIYEVMSNFDGDAPWLVLDLTTLNPGTPLVGRGNPIPYIRANGLNAIVYVATDNHVHELRSNFSGSPSWLHTDLSVASGEAVTAATGAWPYQRGDGIDAIVFVGSESTPKLHEISFAGGSWGASLLPAAAVSASERPSGYYPLGGPAGGVVYLSPVSGSPPALRQLTLLNSIWTDEPLPLPNGSTTTPVNPAAFRGFLENLVLYTSKGVQSPNEARGVDIFKLGEKLNLDDPAPSWQVSVF